MNRANKAIIKTRYGFLRAAMPKPIVTRYFINDLGKEELEEALGEQGSLCADYPNAGLGTQVYSNSG